MSWTKQTAADGLPVWIGENSILTGAHPTDLQHESAGWLAVVAFVVAPLALAVIIMSNGGGAVLWVLSSMASWGAIFYVLSQAKRKSAFKGDKWRLNATSSHLEYSSPQSWAVSFGEVARVETGRTADYLPARSIKEPVSPHEWQVFLFLNDGTRRVVYMANADRDGCAALAASIRVHLGAVVGKAGASPSPAASAVPVAQGFDL